MKPELICELDEEELQDLLHDERKEVIFRFEQVNVKVVKQ